jgi:hypothetical protein
MGPPLRSGSPEGTFQMPVSFTHRREGSSILDALHQESITYTEGDELLLNATSDALACG